MKKLSIVFLFILGIFLNSCDEVSAPYSQSGPIDTSKYRNQKVVLFEYTGYYCGYCPPATELAHNLEKTYKDKLFVIGIHAGSLATVRQEHPLDLLNENSNELYALMGNPANPTGSINFIKTGAGSYIYNPSEWEPKIAELLQNEAPLDLSLDASIDKASRKINLNATMTYVATGNKKHRIVAFILEDGIKGFQKNYGQEGDYEDYTHDNVSRGTMNGTFGETYTDTDPKKGDVISKELTYTIASNKTWNLDNLRLVVLIQDPDTYKVIQVAEADLK